MDYIDDFISTIDHTINSKRRRHILGGFLISLSLLFGGLALTIMTLKEENGDKYEEFKNNKKR